MAVLTLNQWMKLSFEEWNEPEEGRTLPAVWVRAFDIPKKLRERISVLWAMGSMLGATQKVDMKTTLRNDFGRIQVAVLKPELIPPTLNVVIGNRWYVARIEVEVSSDEDGVEHMEEDTDEDGL